MLITPFSAVLGDGNYTPIGSLNHELREKDLTLYQIEDLSPEFIWQYGEKIPEIKSGGTFNWPEENEFYVLHDSMELPSIPFPKFSSEFIRTYDLNRNEKGEGAYRDRLRIHLFRVNSK